MPLEECQKKFHRFQELFYSFRYSHWEWNPWQRRKGEGIVSVCILWGKAERKTNAP